MERGLPQLLTPKPEHPMAHSSILGIDEHNPRPRGHDTEALGPSDSSDSGSDMVGLSLQDDDDPNAPVDVALREDSQRLETSVESTGPGLASDMSGTGERRSAGGDGGREAADISPDRIEDPAGAVDGEDLLLTERADDLVNVAEDSAADDPENDPNSEDEDDDDAQDEGDDELPRTRA